MTRVPNTLARSLREYFSDHLPRVRGMSPHTIQSYRDSLVLLLRFVASQQDRPVAALDIPLLDSKQVLAFLHHLEHERGNAVVTRNVRLAALHAFFRYVASQHPEHLDHCQRILGIPFKRSTPRVIDYLEFDELQAVFATVDRSTKDGRRDYALLTTMFNTGARVQEILNLRASDLQLIKPYQIRLFGKGRKERFCPIWPQTAQILRALCSERQLDMSSTAPIFLNHRGQPLTRFGVRYILAKYFDRAKASAPTLAKKRLHPHSMRHSTAIHLLKAGVDLTTISHWMGHESVNTTGKYAVVDLEMKRKALARTEPLGEEIAEPAEWRHESSVLEWLEGL